jgi:hypothetical protein
MICPTMMELRTFFVQCPDYDLKQLTSEEYNDFAEYKGTYTYLEKRKLKN